MNSVSPPCSDVPATLSEKAGCGLAHLAAEAECAVLAQA
jgi:hypothetical protein